MEQERVTNVLQLQPQDKIWSIEILTGRVVIIEFVCVHPHNENYSVFLNENHDGLPKFYNEKLEKEEWWRYDGSIEMFLESAFAMMMSRALIGRYAMTRSDITTLCA